MNKTIYFPGLNGLRAIAAISVVISHITLSLGEFGLSPHVLGSYSAGNPIGLELGNYGVSIFFALSGFLITYLLLAEKDKQEIDIKKFYTRRILRIWPLYYAYLLLAILTMFIFQHEFNFGSFLLYFFYCANVPPFFNIVLPLLGHYWSLGVEEQFYLFWPWIIKKVNKNIFRVISILALTLMAVKIMVYLLYPQSALTTILLMSRFHCMMIGGLGAVLYKQHHQLFLRLIDNKLMQLACWIVIVLSAVNKFHVASLLDNEIISLVTVFLIVGQINTRNRIVNLENKVFDFLGRISYGIYVFHPLVIFYYSIALKNMLPASLPFRYIFVYLIVLGTTILAAYLSFHYFEKHFLKLKEKYVAMSGTNVLHLRKI